VVGEFDDLALMATFGREGRGVFVSPAVLEAETERAIRREGHRPQRRAGRAFYAISVERRISHPCVVAITSAARSQLFEH
jgi:LysR family transcriptional activator of nhaA